MDRPCHLLTPHPENRNIYGDAPPAELIESIRAKGVLTPLLITQDNVIISGHQRWAAAQAAQCTHVPVTHYGSTDPLDILEALIESNRQRVKTNEQTMNEAAALEGIEQERANRRQADQAKRNLKQGQKRPAVTTLSPPEKAKTRQAIGAKIGLGQVTTGKALKVKAAVDVLKGQGKQEEAAQVVSVLNRRGFHTAHKLVQEQGLIPQPVTTAPAQPHYLTLDSWQTLSTQDRRAVIDDAPRKSKEGWNEQKTDDIEWAKWSWNPIVGCLHGCVYCYARDIAENLYPQGFAPALIPSRLYTPCNHLPPTRAEDDIGYKNVFTCSMADLFGKWVPSAWIEAVLAVVRAAPQWNFLFLTKFPLRLAEFTFPDNAWVGTSVDCQARVANAESAFHSVRASVKWLSCEPLLEDLHFSDLSLFQWVVIGGASQSTQTPEYRPPRPWVNHLWEQARAAGCMIYEKTNLLERVREYPGQAHHAVATSSTEGFDYPLLHRGAA